MRKVIAIAAVPGLIAGIYIFVASFFGLTIDKLGPKAFLLHAGIFVLQFHWLLSIGGRRGRTHSVATALGAPQHARALSPLYVVFLTFMALTHAASPEIVNGEYVLNSHGTIVGHISERAYFFLKGWELRLFASGWILVYYALMLYWCFPRQDE